MAAPASKASCSPISSRAKPNVRSSEINNPMRRSFSGNPFSKPSVITNPRSFNTNTPVNSPSDFPRRLSAGRDSVASLREFEDKENGKDQISKPARSQSVRSPSSSSKGTKNFMSPTISAASKVINASPRKKILADRNEPARSSVSSSSDAKSLLTEESELRPVMGLKQKKAEEHSNDCSSTTGGGEREPLKSDADFDSNVSKIDSDSSQEHVTEENDTVNLDPSFKISPRVSVSPSFPVLAPLDADPSLPPYDPKTNYLSPRPQFLHYRPNPRVDLYREREGKQMQDSFVAEMFSDNEESQYEEDSQREPDEASSAEITEEEEGEEAEEKEEEEEEEELHESETEPIRITDKAKAKRVQSKPGFFTRSKFFVLLLVMVIACFKFPVTDSPAFALSMFRGLSPSNLQVPFEVQEFAKANLMLLAQNLQNWRASSFSYISKITSSFRVVHKLGPLTYANLSNLLEGHMGTEYLMIDRFVSEPIGYREVEAEPLEEKYQREVEETADVINEETAAEENELGFEGEGDHESFEPVDQKYEGEIEEEKYQREVEETADEVNELGFEGERDHESFEPVDQKYEGEIEEEKINEEATEQVNEPVEAQAFQEIEGHENDVASEELTTESEEMQQEVVAETKGVESTDIHAARQISMNLEEKLDLAHLASSEAQSSETKPEEPECENDMNNRVEVEENPVNSELEGFTEKLQGPEVYSGRQEDKVYTRYLLSISLLVVCLLATTVVRTMTKKGEPSKPEVKSEVAVPLEQPVLAPVSKLDQSPAEVSNTEHTVNEERLSYSRTWHTEVDLASQSCPSEMSSSLKRSSYSKKGLKESNEAQSQENNKKPRKTYRRESLASSDFSMGGSPSYSYGSFTTYEKIPSKGGDEEIVTPVRRSNRIRQQVTSP